MILESFPVVALEHVAYFTAGGLTGFGVARFLAWSESKARKDAPPTRAQRLQRHVNQRVSSLGLAMMILSLLCFGVGIRVGYVALNAKVTCLDEYANSVADALDARREIAERREAAEDRVIDTVPDSIIGAEQDDTDELLEAVRALQRERQQIERDRLENPLPEAPRKVCE